MSELTALEALEIIIDRAQWCRENGESDMRNIIHTASYLHQMVKDGKPSDEIIAEFTRDDDE
jgi:hypothetical protein